LTFDGEFTVAIKDTTAWKNKNRPAAALGAVTKAVTGVYYILT